MKLLLTLVLCLLLAFIPLAAGAQEIGQRPNIVFIMTDDNNLQTYERAMPKTQVLVAGKGITFENATYSHSLCCPSRSSILRGQYPHNTGVYSNAPPNGGFATFYNRGLNADTIGTDLHSAGYRTGYFGKYLNGYADGTYGTPPKYVPPGYDRWFGARNPVKATFINENHQVVDFADGTHDPHVSEKALTFIQNASGEGKQPFYAALNFFGPHIPEDGPDSYKTRFSSEPLYRPPSYNEEDMSDKPAWMQALPKLDGQALTTEHRNRLRAVSYVDAQVEKVINTLSNTGELDNTYVIFFNDNGYHLGLHRTTHKSSPYIEDIRFPLMVRGPDITPGSHSSTMVQNIDLRPTFEQIAGVPTPGYVDGLSFLDTATTGAPFPRTYAYAEALKIDDDKMKPWKATYTPDSAYHLWPNTGEEELYNLQLDQYELDNILATGAGGETTATEMRGVLDNFATCSGASCHAAGIGR